MKGYKSVYQLYTPASRYLTGAVDLPWQPGLCRQKNRLCLRERQILNRRSQRRQDLRRGKGYEVVLFEGYDSGTADFAPFINKITGAGPDAIMGGGHFADGSTFAKQLSEKQVSVKFIALLVAPPELKFADIGEAAVGVIGPSQWEPQANYSEASAKTAGVAWYGRAWPISCRPTRQAWRRPGLPRRGRLCRRPDPAKGHRDGRLARCRQDQGCPRRHGPHDFYGTSIQHHRRGHGLQTAHEMVYIQWQKDAAGALAKQVVWPAEGKSADPIYPLPR